VPGLSACTGGSPQIVSDPGVAFSADGRVAYFSGAPFSVLSTNPFTPAVGMAASRSFDGGFSWSTPRMVQPVTNDFWDKPELSVDPRRPRVAYYAFDKRLAPGYTSGHSLLSTTTNRGRTWSAPSKLYDPHTSDSWPATSTILVNRDGSLLDVFVLATQAGAGPAQELAIRSDDGGHTWGSPVGIGRSSGQPVNDPVSQNVLQTIDTLPLQTIAPNGDVYVSWLIRGASNASSRIAVARSSDGGRHWIRHSFGVRGQAAMPSVAVAGDGSVGVLYYSIAPSSQAGNWPARVALQTSRDRARHWSRHPVGGPFNLLTADGENYRGCCFVGDYIHRPRQDAARLRRGVFDGQANRTRRDRRVLHPRDDIPPRRIAHRANPKRRSERATRLADSHGSSSARFTVRPTSCERTVASWSPRLAQATSADARRVLLGA
jgi:BNR repeat-like domain